jgi:hypothetical protein
MSKYHEGLIRANGSEIALKVILRVGGIILVFMLLVPLAMGQAARSDTTGNNAIGDCSEINLGQSVQDIISTAGEADFYKFFLETGGIVTVKIESVPPDMKPKVELWNKNGESVRYVTATNPGDSVTLEKSLLAGLYYVAVVDADGKVHAEPYTLTTSLAEAPDTFEPNNGFGDAAEIGFDQVVKAYLCPDDDIDFYRINLSTSGIVTIKVEDVPEDMKPKVELWNKNAESAKYVTATNPGDSLTLEKSLLFGWYYIAVADADKKAHSEPYTLTVSLAATPDAYEPNNGFGDAAEIGFDKKIEAYICPSDDTDFYRLYLDSPSVVTVMVMDVTEDMKPKVELWNKNGEHLKSATATNAGDSTALEIDLQSGWHYIAIVDADGEANREPYAFRVTLGASAEPER